MIQPLNPVANLQAIRRPEGQAEWPGGDAVSQKYPEFPTDKLQEINKKKEEGGRDISRLNDAWKHGTPFNKWGRLNDNALGMQTGRAIYSEMRARGGRAPHGAVASWRWGGGAGAEGGCPRPGWAFALQSLIKLHVSLVCLSVPMFCLTAKRF